MSHEVARWLIALGAVVAWVGVTVLGMGMSYLESADWMVNTGAIASVVGLVALAIGIFVYRATAQPGSTADRARR